MKQGFIEVTKKEYISFLNWLDEFKNGFRYVPMTIADKTAIYFIDDKEHKYQIANRYLEMYNDPERYDIREEVYREWKESL